MNSKILSKYFDHTILKPDATRDEVIRICKEALEYKFFSVCVNPCHVKLVTEQLSGSGVKPCSVIGFPLGANTTKIKMAETLQAIEDGALEIDMVINVGALKENDFQTVEDDILAVVMAAKDKKVKVIIETCLLDHDQKVKACEISKSAGAAFVKTSTGFAGGGATVKDVALMKKTVGDQLEVKASGGIKTKEDVQQLIEAGATRIGASASVEIVKAKD